MFSGIIEYVGTVATVGKLGSGKSFCIEAGPLADGAKPGDSLSVNGVCLTATSIDEHIIKAEAVTETLTKTNLGSLKTGDRVNLERSLAAGDRIHGHIVQGHVDDVTTVGSVERLDESVLLTFALNERLDKFIVGRGSVAVDGVSLTVARLTKEGFTVSLVGFTLNHTTLGMRRPGDIVNVETDIIGKYVVATLERTGSAQEPLTVEKLQQWGY